MRININKTIKKAEKIKSDLVSCKTGADLIKLMKEQEKLPVDQRYDIVYAVDSDTHLDIDFDNINPDTVIEEIGLGYCGHNINLPICNPQTGYFVCTIYDSQLGYQYGGVIDQYLDTYKIKDTLIGKRAVLKTEVAVKSDGGSSPSPAAMWHCNPNGKGTVC